MCSTDALGVFPVEFLRLAITGQGIDLLVIKVLQYRISQLSKECRNKTNKDH